jgi:hypothetical protein
MNEMPVVNENKDDNNKSIPDIITDDLYNDKINMDEFEDSDNSEDKEFEDGEELFISDKKEEDILKLIGDLNLEDNILNNNKNSIIDDDIDMENIDADSKEKISGNPLLKTKKIDKKYLKSKSKRKARKRKYSNSPDEPKKPITYPKEGKMKKKGWVKNIK